MDAVRRAVFAILLVSWCMPAWAQIAPSSTDVEQMHASPAADPALIQVNPRRAAAAVAVLVSTLLGVLFLLRRQRYICDWSWAWFLASVALYLASRGYPSEWLTSPASLSISVFIGGAATMTVLGAQSFRDPAADRRAQVLLLLPALTWFVLARTQENTAIVISGCVALALVMGRAAYLYYRGFRERRMFGALFVSGLLLAIATTDLVRDSLETAWGLSPDGSMAFLVTNAVMYSFLALSMHFLVFEDMTAALRGANRNLEAAQQELLELATTDPLTGCYNRRFLDQIKGRELERHRRFRIPLSLLFVDVDGFKSINDLHGHEEGDRVLRFVADFLRQHVRGADYVIRWGGDEFLLMLACSEAEAHAKADALKAAFDRAPETVRIPPGMRLSIGCAEVPRNATDLAPLVHEADRRMYQDKVPAPPVGL